MLGGNVSFKEYTVQIGYSADRISPIGAHCVYEVI